MVTLGKPEKTRLTTEVQISLRLWQLQRLYMIRPEPLFLLLSEKDKFKRALLAGWQCGAYSKAQPCRISTIWKKMPHKIYDTMSNRAQKKYTQGSLHFF